MLFRSRWNGARGRNRTFKCRLIWTGLDEVDLGEALGKGESYVSLYETGGQRLDILELKKVSEICKICVTQFIKRLEVARPFRGVR